MYSYRLLAHASAYYELGSFLDGEKERALQKFEQCRLVIGEDGGRKVKTKVLA